MGRPTWEALLPELQIAEIEESETQVTVRAAIKGERATCPKCGVASSSVHSYRSRRVAELPVLGRSVLLDLQVRRFRCGGAECACRTFTEVIPGFIERRSRRTVRLQAVLTAVGMELGGQAGSRLAAWLAMPVSGSTLLRMVRRYRRPAAEKPLSAVGIDDWALSRGRRYGTILVDLKRHRPVGLTPSRESKDVIPWLSTMATPHVLARDRSTDYQRAVSQAWPGATQVADRWHLLKNLHEALERVCASQRSEVVRAAAGLPTGQVSRFAQSRWRSAREEARRHALAQRRQSRHRRVHKLREAGLTIRQIAKRLRVGHSTVCNDLQLTNPPGPVFHRRRASILDPYVDQLDKRWAEGCTNAAQLLREICERGYPGTRRPLYKWVALRRVEPAKTAPTRSIAVSDWASALPAPRRLAWLILQSPADLDASDKRLVAALLKCDVFKRSRAVALEFKRAIKRKSFALFKAWRSHCLECAPPPLRSFAKGMESDLAAIANAIKTPWSNAQSEGQINRLKTLKRQMYGRAKIDLLEARLLWPARHR